MPDMLSNAAAWLDGRRKLFLSKPAVYRRGELHCAVTVTPAASPLLLAAEGGTTVQAAPAVLILSVADLALNGALTRPRIGDRIEVEGDNRPYEVLDTGAGPYEEIAAGYMFRVFCKRTD